jgi:Nucleotide-diphospho-sugar transferase
MVIVPVYFWINLVTNSKRKGAMHGAFTERNSARTMARLLPRLQYLTQFIRIAAVTFLVWRNVRQLLQSQIHRRGDVYEDRLDEIDPHVEFLAKLPVVRRSTSVDELQEVFEPVEPTFFDEIDSKDWPPTGMLESVVRNSPYAMSDLGIPPNAPRLIVAPTTFEDVDLADSFANNLLALNVDNFVLVPLDMRAYRILLGMHPRHTLPVLPGLKPSHHGDAERIHIMQAFRPIVISLILKRGYAVFYNDVDMVWQHNVWDEVDRLFYNTTANRAGPNSLPSVEQMFWKDREHLLCNCMMYLLPTINSLYAMEKWGVEIRSQVHEHDQAALTELVDRLTKPWIWGAIPTIGITPNDATFPAAEWYSWDAPSPENNLAVILHNNFCTTKEDQRHRFVSVGLWKPSGTGGPPIWPPSDFLESLLAKALTPSSVETTDGIPRVIVAASSFDFVDFADNFANSLLKLNITNFVFVPLDAKAYEALHAAYPDHTLPTMPGLQNQPDDKHIFKTLTSSRPYFVEAFLRKGYAVLYNDIDIVWQHNAWDFIDELNINNKFDKIMWQDTDSQVCSCMFYLLPTADSVLLMDEWQDEISSDAYESDPTLVDQATLAVVLKRRDVSSAEGSFATTKIIVNDTYFPAGNHFSWNKLVPENEKAIIVHNGIDGKRNKKSRFIRSRLWKPSGRIITGTDASWPPTEFLDTLLKKAILPSSVKTRNGIPRLVIAASSYEYIEFADNFANSLLSLDITNFVLVPLDSKAQSTLEAAFPDHTLPMIPEIDNQRDIFETLTSIRPLIVQSFLRKGYAIFYNDIDVVWRINAWDVVDFQNVNNGFDKIMWQDSDSEVCSCMLYLLPTADSVLLMEEWEAEISSDSSSFDQGALTAVVKRRNISTNGGSFDTAKVIVNDMFFPSGKLYYWNERKPENENAVIVRNNGIVGKKNKKSRFMRSKLWKPSGRIITGTDAKWPPKEFLDSVLVNPNLPSSVKTRDGIPRLIVAASNFDYLDFADNFAHSLLRLNITNFVFVPLDTKVHDALKAAYPEHTLPTMPGLENHPDGKAEFGSAVFKTLTSSRPQFIQAFLRKGYAVLYNDIDIVWQHNTWDVLDFQNVDNRFDKIMWQDTDYQVCSCMLYLLPTADSIFMMEEWEDEISSDSHQSDPASFDQEALAVVLVRRNISTDGGTFDSTKVIVNDMFFPAGKHYSWNDSKPENEKAIMVHNNWIVGKPNKKARFMRSNLWKPSGRIATSDA